MKYVVAAVLLVLAVIAIPNLHHAMENSKEKRTLADMRAIATAWEARAKATKPYAIGRSSRVSFQDLRHALEPKYVTHLERTDGWGKPFEFTATGDQYSIRAWGSDRRRDAKLAEGPYVGYEHDAVYANGKFISYPEGVM